MKELSIEEKAKLYDKALERAKNTIEVNQAIPDIVECVESLFPELAGSKDEKIRKALIKYFSEGMEYLSIIPYNKEQCVAWLEKQGNHSNFLSKIQVGDKVTRNEDGVLVNLSQLKRVAKPAENKGKHGMGISEATKQKLEDNLNEALEKETPESLNEFLDEQGEQKTADITDKIKEEYQKGWNAAMQQLPKEVDSQIWQIANNSAKTWEESFVILCATQKAYDKGKKDALKEQKPAWSEEDEKCIRLSTDIIDNALRAGFCVQLDRDRCVDWFKSFKERYTWKPSDGQMKALDIAIRCGIQLGTWEEETLKSLKNELEKL